MLLQRAFLLGKHAVQRGRLGTWLLQVDRTKRSMCVHVFVNAAGVEGLHRGSLGIRAFSRMRSARLLTTATRFPRRRGDETPKSSQAAPAAIQQTPGKVQRARTKLLNARRQRGTAVAGPFRRSAPAHSRGAIR